MEPIGSLETSFENHLTPRNGTENGRIHFSRGESLRSRSEPEGSLPHSQQLATCPFPEPEMVVN
jgi:hypothetical protein